MLERVLANSVFELGTRDIELFWLECQVLNERLEDLEVDVAAHGEGRL